MAEQARHDAKTAEEAVAKGCKLGPLHGVPISIKDLLEPIAAYFTADQSDSEAISRCFTDNAVVKDECHVHIGIAAIKQWKTGASKKYTY